jgi:hypothetical protein
MISFSPEKGTVRESAVSMCEMKGLEGSNPPFCASQSRRFGVDTHVRLGLDHVHVGEADSAADRDLAAANLKLVEMAAPENGSFP